MTLLKASMQIGNMGRFLHTRRGKMSTSVRTAMSEDSGRAGYVRWERFRFPLLREPHGFANTRASGTRSTDRRMVVGAQKTRGRAGLQSRNADVTERRDLPLCVCPVDLFDQGTMLGGPVESPSLEDAVLANRSWCSFASARWTKGAGVLRAISRNLLASSGLSCAKYKRAR